MSISFVPLGCLSVTIRRAPAARVMSEARSVTRQIEHAKDYAVRKGWMVDEAAVFVDADDAGAVGVPKWSRAT